MESKIDTEVLTCDDNHLLYAAKQLRRGKP